MHLLELMYIKVFMFTAVALYQGFVLGGENIVKSKCVASAGCFQPLHPPPPFFTTFQQNLKNNISFSLSVFAGGRS